MSRAKNRSPTPRDSREKLHAILRHVTLHGTDSARAGRKFFKARAQSRSVPGMHGTPYFSTARPLARVWMSESLHHAPPRPLGGHGGGALAPCMYVRNAWYVEADAWRDRCVVHHIRVTPLLGTAHRPREARGTFKVNNPYPTHQACNSPQRRERAACIGLKRSAGP